MSEFELSAGQANTLEILVDLIGLSGVHKRPEQGDCIVLDLLPGEHIWGAEPFCVRVSPDGRMERISDAEAGLDHRPDPLEALFLSYPQRGGQDG